MNFLNDSGVFGDDGEYEVINLETGKFDSIRPVTRQAKVRPQHRKNQGSLPNLNRNMNTNRENLLQSNSNRKLYTSQRKSRSRKRYNYAPYSINMLKTRMKKLNMNNLNTKELGSDEINGKLLAPILTSKEMNKPGFFTFKPRPSDILLKSATIKPKNEVSKKFVGSLEINKEFREKHLLGKKESRRSIPKVSLTHRVSLLPPKKKVKKQKVSDSKHSSESSLPEDEKLKMEIESLKNEAEKNKRKIGIENILSFYMFAAAANDLEYVKAQYKIDRKEMVNKKDKKGVYAIFYSAFNDS